MKPEQRKHPSGRPISQQINRKLSIYRVPTPGPVTPRLQYPEPKDAIGFHRIDIDRSDDESPSK